MACRSQYLAEIDVVRKESYRSGAGWGQICRKKSNFRWERVEGGLREGLGEEGFRKEQRCGKEEGFSRGKRRNLRKMRSRTIVSGKYSLEC